MIPLDQIPAGPGVYIIHIEPPLHHARNYCGSAASLRARLAADLAGTGARLPAAALRAGRVLSVARIWKAATVTEARMIENGLKDRRATPKICPECTPGTVQAITPKQLAQRRPNRNPPVRKSA